MSNKYLDRLASIGCIACRKMGYEDSSAEIHHIRETVGMGQRAGHDEAIPLCPAHHRGTHHPHVPSIHRARREFIARFGTELELLRETKDALGLPMDDDGFEQAMEELIERTIRVCK